MIIAGIIAKVIFHAICIKVELNYTELIIASIKVILGSLLIPPAVLELVLLNGTTIHSEPII